MLFRSGAKAALASEARRLQQRRPAVCAQLVQVAELEELDADPVVTNPRPGRIGLAAASKKVGRSDAIFVLTVLEAASCK